MSAIARMGIGWQVGVASGWGTYGTNLAIELARWGIEPALFFASGNWDVTPAQADLLRPALAAHKHWRSVREGGSAHFDFPMLHGLGDKLDFPDFLRPLRGSPDIGVVFFESATIPAERLKEAREAFAVIITGSTWNAEILSAKNLTVRKCLQGIDTSLFKPGPRIGQFDGRFAVFSGGKLEYRKGQDLVVAAFKKFHQRHPDAVLITAWHNPWPAVAKGLAVSPHIAGPPAIKPNGMLDVEGWLRANGLPEGSFIDLGEPLKNIATPAILREMDVTLLPSRCEGGTNLVAMECMACGIPVILSRNTGHLDLIRPGNCYSLDMQIPMGAVTGRADLEGWGESSIEEIVAKLEEAYTDKEERKRRGAAAAAFMQDWDWAAQVGRLVEAVGEFT